MSDWPQTGSCHKGPDVAPNPVSQCASARMATTIASLGPEWLKSAVYPKQRNKSPEYSVFVP